MVYLLCDEEHSYGELTPAQYRKLKKEFDITDDDFYTEEIGLGYHIWKPEKIKDNLVDEIILVEQHYEAMDDCNNDCENCKYRDVGY